MKNLGLGLLAVVLALLVSLLGAKIILSVSSLFGLTFLTDLGYLKIYGLTSIIYALNYKKKTDAIDGEDIDETLGNVFKTVFDKIRYLLVFWGLSYVMHSLITSFGA